MPYKLIAFDLDGTLVDSAPDIAAAVDGMLLELGRMPLGIEPVRHFLGNGVERLTKRVLTGEMWAEPPAALFEQALTCLLRHYESNNGHRTLVYPGAAEILSALQAAGIRLCCITNKKRRFTEPLLADLQLLGYFDFLVCGDDLVANKPDPMALLHAISQAGVDAPETLMVGDSVTDVKTARAAGVRVVAVSYGYNHGEDIREAGPDWVVDSLAGICTIAGLPE